MDKQKLVEIARSYSEKVNTGNYQSMDFFCSQKLEVPESEAEEASKRAFDFCYRQVKSDIARLKAESERPVTPVHKPFAPMTPDEWENLSVEEQAKLQAQKKDNNKVKYQVDKQVGFIKRYPCNVCNEDHPITQKKCPATDAVEGVGAERGSK